MAKDDDTYGIGYGKPPANRRFQKGQSGNPRGRPKGSVDLSAEVWKELRRTIPIKENGKPTRMKALQVIIRRAVTQAMAGDYKARQDVLRLMQASEPAQGSQAPAALTPEMQEFLLSLNRELDIDTEAKPEPEPEPEPEKG